MPSCRPNIPACLSDKRLSRAAYCLGLLPRVHAAEPRSFGTAGQPDQLDADPAMRRGMTAGRASASAHFLRHRPWQAAPEPDGRKVGGPTIGGRPVCHMRHRYLTRKVR